MCWHLDLLHETHLSHVPEIDEAVVASAREDGLIVFLQPGHLAKVRVLEQSLVLLQPHVPQAHRVVMPARQECVLRHWADLLDSSGPLVEGAYRLVGLL